MGSMGFGLQEWVYKLRPRKPFKKREKTMGYDTLDDNFLDFDNKELAFKKKGSKRIIAANAENIEERILEKKKILRFNLWWDNAYNIIAIFALIAIIVIAILKTTDFGDRISREIDRILYEREAQK